MLALIALLFINSIYGELALAAYKSSPALV